MECKNIIFGEEVMSLTLHHSGSLFCTSSYFTSLNEIAKLSSINSFELHILKLAPFSRNHKIKSG